MKKALALLALTLAACGDDHPTQAPQVQAAAPAAAPVVVNNSGGSNGAGDALLGLAAGGALGYMAGRSSSNATAVAPQPQVIERHYTTRIVEKAPAAPAPAQTALKAPETPKVTPAPAPAAPVTPRVTYSTNFTQKPSTPPPRVSTPAYTSRPGAYSSGGRR